MKFFISALWVLLSPFLHANDIRQTLGEGDVSVIIPSALQLVQVDNQGVSGPDLHSGSYRLRLQSGEHQIAVRYVENWNDNEESGMIVESQPVVIRYDFISGQRLQLSLPNISDFDTAERFSENPRITLKQGNLVLATSHAVITAEQHPNTEPSLIHYESNRLKAMKTLWQQASEQERTEFWLWLKPQDR